MAPYAGWGVLAGRLETAVGGNPGEPPIDIYDTNGKVRPHGIYTYGPRVAHPDDAWQENFAISDMPAGAYFLQANIPKAPLKPTW